MPRQLSFFSAETQEPALSDLAGLLCGPGQCVRRDEATRISVVVRDPWRVEALLDEMWLRGLEASTLPAGDGVSVRTAFSAELTPLGRAWGSTGTGKHAPRGLVVEGPVLRLWCIAAGEPSEAGYTLGLGEHDEESWETIGAALARSGLPATFVGSRGPGPAYRVTSARRLARLAEMVGDPPSSAPDGTWPS